MDAVILANAHVIKAVLLLALVGLFWRGGHHACRPLAGYLCATLLCNTLMSLWPETFYRYSFWAFKEGVYSLLQFSIAVAIGRRAFHAFPGARAVAGAAYAGIAVAILLLLIWLPPGGGSVETWRLQIITRWNARVLAATIAAFSAVSFLVVFFRVPILTFHRQILLGFTAWLALAALTRDLLDALGPDARDAYNLVESFAALGFNLWCARSAWSYRGDDVLVSPEAAEALAAFSAAT